MSGESIDEAQFKGWQKHFNTVTERGRFNISVTTLSLAAAGIAFVLLKRKLTKKNNPNKV